MSSNENNNSFLYFVVGALVVAVFTFGFVMYQDRGGENMSQIEASAGGESFELEITDDSVRASSEEQ